MKKAPLDRRIEAFTQFEDVFERVTPLTVCAKIPKLLFLDLQSAVAQYRVGDGLALMGYEYGMGHHEKHHT